jgi:hypothetical protein
MSDLGPTVRFRITHDGAPPPHGKGQPYVFGLEGKGGVLTSPEKLPGGGLAFDVELRVKAKDGGVNFLGDHAHGPVDDRMFRLGWKEVPPGPGWINRINVRLSNLGIATVLEAQQRNARIETSAAGRLPHDAKLPDWRVVDG